ncbi:hypothetical protein GCM10023065_29950 [Microbacterium laevaniformans]|uniref:putative immunity protein n=1 Tax=Microbacterium laevaniformans TaxID=36807 RepID=UPI0031EBEEBF
MLSPQTLSEPDRRLVAAWSADCAERVLPLFEREAPDDDRPRDAIARARAYARGELDSAGEIRRRFVAGRAAASVTSPAAIAAARSAAQASGVAHMGAHALGAAAYAVKSVSTARPDDVDAEIEWQLQRMDTGRPRPPSVSFHRSARMPRVRSSPTDCWPAASWDRPSTRCRHGSHPGLDPHAT